MQCLAGLTDNFSLILFVFFNF